MDGHGTSGPAGEGCVLPVETPKGNLTVVDFHLAGQLLSLPWVVWATTLGRLLNNGYHSSEKRKQIKTMGHDVPRGSTEGELKFPSFHS